MSPLVWSLSSSGLSLEDPRVQSKVSSSRWMNPHRSVASKSHISENILKDYSWFSFFLLLFFLFFSSSIVAKLSNAFKPTKGRWGFWSWWKLWAVSLEKVHIINANKLVTCYRFSIKPDGVGVLLAVNVNLKRGRSVWFSAIICVVWGMDVCALLHLTSQKINQTKKKNHPPTSYCDYDN